jgi:hypothetical protein
MEREREREREYLFYGISFLNEFLNKHFEMMILKLNVIMVTEEEGEVEFSYSFVL